MDNNLYYKENNEYKILADLNINAVKTSYDAISNGVDDVLRTFKRAQSFIDNSVWEEEGVDELKSNALPNLISFCKILNENITGPIKNIVDTSMELVDVLEKLKQEEENLKKLNEEYKAIKRNATHIPDENGGTKLSDSSLNELNKKEKEIVESESKCQEYKERIEELRKIIRNSDYAIKSFSPTISSSSKITINNSLVDKALKEGKMFLSEVEGRIFCVVNTKINPFDYEAYLQKYKIYQNMGVLVKDCPILSQYQVMDMMRGSLTKKDDVKALEGSPAAKISDTCSSPNLEDVLDYIFNKALDSTPTTFRATQALTKKEQKTHVVTAIGFDVNINGIEDLNPNTLLVLDCVDGKIQTLGKSRSEGGHERDFVKVRNAQGELVYVAHGPTDAFLKEDVENDAWINSNWRWWVAQNANPFEKIDENKKNN